MPRPLLATIFLPFLTSLAGVSAATAAYTAPALQTAQAEATQSPEAYRLRFANIIHGAVEISTNRGATWLVVSRVGKPATMTARRVGAGVGRVYSSTDTGITLGVGPGRCVRVLPDTPAARKDAAAIVLTVGRGSGPFAVLRPPAGAMVKQEARKRASDIPADYLPQEGDLLQVCVESAPVPAARLAEEAAAVAARHTDAALARLQAAGEKPVNGMLTVKAKVPPAKRPGMCVIMESDTGQTAILSTAPFEVRWDTSTWRNGEHVIEARTVDSSGAVLRRKRALVFVRNGP